MDESDRVRQHRVHMRVEFLWFEACPNQETARAVLTEVLEELAPGTAILDIDATDPDVAARWRFPGSPTIRVDGDDIDPGFSDPGDYTPRCRVFRTRDGLRGVPPRMWIEDAVRRSLAVG